MKKAYILLVLIASLGLHNSSEQGFAGGKTFCGVPLVIGDPSVIVAGEHGAAAALNAPYPFIVISPRVGGQLHKFLLNHECGHIRYGWDECAADRYAARAIGIRHVGTAEHYARLLGSFYGSYRYSRFMNCWR